MAVSFEQATQDIIAAGRWIDGQGFAPATAGNYSMRLHSGDVAVTVSGAHKGHLSPAQIMRVDLEGAALDEKKPSAETLLHTGLYQMYPGVHAILHTHSVPCVVLSRLLAGETELVLEGYELLKAFPGIETHETRVAVPIFENSQDIAALSLEVSACLKNIQNVPVYIIRGHGLYGWGKDMAEALRVIEAAEVLFSCELAMRQIRQG